MPAVLVMGIATFKMKRIDSAGAGKKSPKCRKKNNFQEDVVVDS